jgi:cytochrome P450
VVVCSLLAINRAKIPSGPADELDIAREDGTHMAFGHGIHHCIGAALARLELGVGYLALLRRFPGLRLAIPREELRFRSYAPNYNLESLPVAW